MRNNMMVVAGISLVSSLAWTTIEEPVKLSPASQLTVQGKSTVRDWKCSAEVLQGAIDAQVAEPTARILAGDKAITSVELTIPVEKLNCANNTMNEHMLKAMKAKEFPTIVFKLSSYDLANADSGKAAVLRGTLKMGGVEKPVTLNASLAAGSEGGLRVRGTYTLAMTEYGIKPPSLMLGTMKVKDQVVVGFDLLLDK